MKKIVPILLSLILLVGCAPSVVSERNRVAYLGVGEVVFGELALTGYLYDWGEDKADLIAVKSQILGVLSDIDREVNVNRADSDVARFNASELGHEIGTHAEAIARMAQEYAQTTHGAFDVTLAPLSALWQVDAEQIYGTHADFAVPTQNAVDEALSRTGMDKWSIESIDGQAYLLKSHPLVTVDFGAVAKGYACDRILDILKQNNVAAAQLSLSGNVVIHGAMPDVQSYRGAYYYTGEDPFTCAITDPWSAGSLLSFATASGEGVVTSGDYERCFEHGCVTYSHIINPFTGLPVNVIRTSLGTQNVTDGALTSVTVFDCNGARADAYATAILVMGMSQGLAWARQNGVEALLVGADGKYACTTQRTAYVRKNSTWGTRALAAVDGCEVKV